MPREAVAMFDKVSAQVQQLDRAARSWIIGAVRMLAGALWLANLHWKVPGDFGEDTGRGLYKYSASAADAAPFGPFRWVVDEIVLPNFQLFGWFTLISETIIAALLLIGYRTKLVALAGALFTVPILLSVIYYPNADEWSWSYLLMIGVHLLLIASDAGAHLGVDGILRNSAGNADDQRAKRPATAMRTIGIVAAVIGLLGLFVARSIDFAGDQVALLGSDAGFANDDGSITRRWELKLLFFNPLWAVLTIAGGALLIVGARRVWAAWSAIGLFAGLTVVAFVMQTFVYVRDDGGMQEISTGTNMAVWGACSLAGLLLLRRNGREHPST